MSILKQHENQIRAAGGRARRLPLEVELREAPTL